MTNKEIRILLVGDEGVGKSTIILSLIKDGFVNKVQHLVPEVTLPPEVTLDNVTTHIIDTSNRPDYKEKLLFEASKSSVICLVFSLTNRESFYRIESYWIPLFRQLNLNLPIILAGSKLDLESPTKLNMEEDILPIMKNYSEIETCIQVSSAKFINLQELFFICQKAVLYPTAPIFNLNERALTQKCTQALKRIFLLSDLDKDGILNDYELNLFQQKHFGSPLQSDEIYGIKSIVKQQEPNGVINDGLTELGFLYLHSLFIQRGRLETTWNILHKFGYNDKLEINQDRLCPKIEVPTDYTVELSPNGYQFLTELFQVHDKDKDGALNTEELEELFSPAPQIPWGQTDFPNSTVTNESGSVTLQGFLAQWSMSTFQDYPTTLKYLFYLGYDGDTREALKLVKPGSRLKKGSGQKNVFNCYLIGGPQTGKTSILNHFVNKAFLPTYTPTTKPHSSVNSVEFKGQEKYLILEEFGTNYESAMLQNSRKLNNCDVIGLVYDGSDSNSFIHVVNLIEQYEFENTPLVLISTKGDLEQVRQRTGQIQPEEYCEQIKIKAPLSISVKLDDVQDLYTTLLSAAINQTKKNSTGSLIVTLATYTAITGVSIVVGMLILKNWKHTTGSFSSWFSIN